jgi:starch phosphorylase
MAGKMKVVFLPDYDVSLAERIVAATDLSEQIATPGQEACGTSNMKFALNGAITIASKGGSNIELIKRIGEDNIIVFGKGIEELPDPRRYQPFDLRSSNKHLSSICALLEERLARLPQNGLSINPLVSTLKDSDRFFVLFDFDDYILKQNTADALFLDAKAWLSKGVLAIARSGWFSIDRTVMEYVKEIWGVGSRL